MRLSEKIKRGVGVAVLFCLAGALLTIQAQEIRTMDYIVNMGGRVFVVTNNQSALLEHEFILTTDLNVMTNGIIKIKGDGQVKLQEGRKVSLDGFWMNDDGVLAQFKPHYMMKDGGLMFVEDGIFTRVDHAVVFKNGTVLGTDGVVLTRDQRMTRLQDGQALTVEGKTLPALDQVMMSNGNLVLQKDGSIVALPAGRTIGMSDGTKVQGGGVITRKSGEQVMLKEGQRLVLDGAAMREID